MQYLSQREKIGVEGIYVISKPEEITGKYK
jgi:hypothetical protein